MEVKVRGDKRLSSGEQNCNLCSDQRASLWRQEGGKSPADDARSFQLYQRHRLKMSRPNSLLCVKIKERGEISALLGLKRPLRSCAALTRGSDVLNERVKCQRVGGIGTSCHGLVTPPDSRDPRRCFYWWLKENGPTQRSSEPTYEPDEAFPLSATCQEQSRNVVAIGYAAARWAGRLEVTQTPLFVLPVTLSAALL